MAKDITLTKDDMAPEIQKAMKVLLFMFDKMGVENFDIDARDKATGKHKVVNVRLKAIK